MKVLYDAAWDELGGIGRYGRELCRLNPDWVKLNARLRGSSPLAPLSLSLSEWSSRKRADVLFSPGFLPPIKSFVPTLVTIHDLMYFADGGSPSISRQGYFEAIRRLYLQEHLAIATVSNYSARRIANWLGVDPEHICLTGNGVAEIFFAAERQPGDFALIVSSERPNKNLIGQLDACSRATEFDRVVWVAPAEPSAPVRSFIDSLPMKVDTEVAIDDARLARLYQTASVLSCFSLDEGFGLPAAEALASGCPVAHSSRGGLTEVVGSAGVIGDPESLDSMRRALDEAVVRRENLEPLAREQASQFTWHTVSQRVNSALSTLTQRSG